MTEGATAGVGVGVGGTGVGGEKKYGFSYKRRDWHTSPPGRMQS